MQALLADVEATIRTLTETSILLVEAARWADRDRNQFSPGTVIAGPVKYWKWWRAKRRLAKAREQIHSLRTRSAEARALPDAEVEFSKLDMLNDVFDALPFNLHRVGTPGGPSPIKQQLFPEMTALNEIETARVGVDHLLSEVGLLHAKLRAAHA